MRVRVITTLALSRIERLLISQQRMHQSRRRKEGEIGSLLQTKVREVRLMSLHLRNESG